MRSKHELKGSLFFSPAPSQRPVFNTALDDSGEVASEATIIMLLVVRSPWITEASCSLRIR